MNYLDQFNQDTDNFYKSLNQANNPQQSQQGLLGDSVDALQMGALSASAGLFNLIGADGIADSLQRISDDQLNQMSATGRAAMQKEFITEDEQGRISLGDAVTDLDAWVLNLANVVGQFVPTAIPGGAAAKGLSTVAKLGAKGKALVTSGAMGTLGGAAATGQAGLQAQHIIENMADEDLVQSAPFQQHFKQLRAAQPNGDLEQLFEQAKTAVKEQIEAEVMSDPKLLVANFAASAIGDPIIAKSFGRALGGSLKASIAKGFVTEGASEFAQGATEHYTVREHAQKVDPTLDPNKGMIASGLNEALIGGTMGGTMAAVGHVRMPKPAATGDAALDAAQQQTADLVNSISANKEAQAAQAQVAAQTAEPNVVQASNTYTAPELDQQLTNSMEQVNQWENKHLDAMQKQQQKISHAIPQGLHSTIAAARVLDFQKTQGYEKQYKQDQNITNFKQGLLSVLTTNSLVAPAPLDQAPLAEDIPDNIDPETGELITTVNSEQAKQDYLAEQQQQRMAPVAMPAPQTEADKTKAFLDAENRRKEQAKLEAAQDYVDELSTKRQQVRSKLLSNNKKPLGTAPEFESLLNDAIAIDPQGMDNHLARFAKSEQSPADIEALQQAAFDIAATGDATQSRLQNHINAQPNKQQRIEQAKAKQFNEDNLTSAKLAQEAQARIRRTETQNKAWADAEQKRFDEEAAANTPAGKIQARKAEAVRVVDNIINQNNAAKVNEKLTQKQFAQEQEPSLQAVRDADYAKAQAQQAEFERQQQTGEAIKQRLAERQQSVKTNSGVKLVDRRIASHNLQQLAKKLKPKRKAFKKQLRQAGASPRTELKLGNALESVDKGLPNNYQPSSAMADAFNAATQQGDNAKAQAIARVDVAKERELARIKDARERAQTKQQLETAIKTWFADDASAWSETNQKAVNVESVHQYSGDNITLPEVAPITEQVSESDVYNTDAIQDETHTLDTGLSTETVDNSKPVNTNRQLLDNFKGRDLSGVTDNNSLKKLAAELDGVASSKDVDAMRLKEVQEAYETVEVTKRREKINNLLNTEGVEAAFVEAVDSYNNQPNLDVRTKNSSDLMAYSTPTPMSLLANLAAGVNSKSTVYEPTAGNGLLLMTADPSNVIANELDPVRADSLAWSGYKVTTEDAAKYKPSKQVDAVLANPPFGALRDESGKRTRYDFADAQGKSHSFGELDHVIAKRALDALKEDGKATLIIGAPKQASDYKGNNKAFLNWLYNNYNVVHHVEADGSLYRGQGAAWPTQMIVIHGRETQGTGKFSPLPGDIKRYDNWEDIYESFSELGLLDTESGTFSTRQGAGELLSQPTRQADSTQRKERDSNANSGSDRQSEWGRQVRTDGTVADTRKGERATSTDDNRPVTTERDAEQGELASPASEAATIEPSASTDGSANSNGLSRTHTAVEADRTVKRANQFQATYQSASSGFNEGVLTPINMASYTQAALAGVSARHGSVDGFVKEKLNYATDKELHKAFMGLQVDAAALAIDNMEQGRAIVIGDQTGVGKGRQAAAVMRYAMEQGKIPVFVTQKPNLFTDMYDDLADIGVTDFKPLIMNADSFISKGGDKLFKLNAKERSDLLDKLSSTKALPEDYKALFLTYSQISSDQNGNKTALLNSIAKDAIFVLDESHSAAGQGSKLGKAFQSLVDNAAGVTYLSATYAKRPDNMLLYSRTDLGLATDTKDGLVDAVMSGGLGMQTYIAGKLAEAGQMIRRERSFDGINIENRIMADSTGEVAEGFNEVTTALRAIQDLSAAWARYVKKDLAKDIARSSGLETNVAGNKADKNINVTLFSSVVHNYIAQLSLGLKAKQVASLAVDAIKQGKRPVIALENTMGAALESYMEQTGKGIGDSAKGLSFASLLEKVADGVLAYSVKQPGSKKSQKVQVPISAVSDGYVQHLYQQVLNVVGTMDTTNVPASPIDAIRDEIKRAGYSVAEITGRDKYVDYGNGAKIINKPVDEKDRRNVVDRFNDGSLDVIILNQAGSTGLSLHAKEGFADTNQRHMIVAQPSLDINTFMQMLGRVNRTGQIVKPSYDLAWLDLPSEKRPAAVLARKMTSLNANTSGNKDSATSVDSVDMLNVYGDEVVKNFVDENHAMLAEFNPRLVELPPEDQASYFLGKLAVLPVKVQEEVLTAVESEYTSYINYLNATGQNELDTTELDLDAKPLEQKVLAKGKAGAGVFAEDTYLTKVDVKAQGKAPKWSDVESELAEQSQADFDQAIADMKADLEYPNTLKKRANKVREKIASLTEQGKKVDTQNVQLLRIEEQLSDYQSQLNEISNLFGEGGTLAHGAYVRLNVEGLESTVSGVVTGLKYTHEQGKGSPTTKGKWQVNIMVASRMRSIPTNLKQLKEGGLDGKHHVSQRDMASKFDRVAALPNREERYIMTGNLIEAVTRSKQNGRIVPFTTHDGRVIQGMLMPAGFTPENGIKEKLSATPKQMVDWLTTTNTEHLASLGLSTQDGTATLRKAWRGGYELEMPKSKKQGLRFWGDPRIEKIIGEQAVKGNGTLKVKIDDADLVKVAKAVHAVMPLELKESQVNDYKKQKGIKDKGFSLKGVNFSKQQARPLSDKELNSARVTLNKKVVALELQKFANEFKGLKGEDGKGTEVRILRHPFDVTEWGGESAVRAAGAERASGAYETKSNTLYLFTDNIHTKGELQKTIRHELLVHKGLGLFSKENQKAILEKINSSRKTLDPRVKKIWQNIDKNYSTAPELVKAEEFLARLAETNFNNQPWHKRLLEKLGDAFMSLLQKLRFIDKNTATYAAMKDLVADIEIRLRRGDSPEPRPPSGPDGDLLFRKDGEVKSHFDKLNSAMDAALNGVVNLKNLSKEDQAELKKSAGDRAHSLYAKHRSKVLGLMPRTYLTDVAKKLTPIYKAAVDAFQQTVQKMDALRSNLQEISFDQVKTWQALHDKDPDNGKLFAELLHDATLENVDPSLTEYQAAMTESQFLAIKKKLFNKVMESKSLDDQHTFSQTVNAAQAALLREESGQRFEAWQELSARFKALPPEWQAQFNTVVEAYKKQSETKFSVFKQRIKEETENKQYAKRMLDLWQVQYEMNHQRGFYVPLQRFGEYSGIVKRPDTDTEKGETLEFSLFENEYEQKKWLEEKREEYGTQGVEISGGKKAQFNQALDGVSASFMRELLPKLSKSLSEDVYQLYLEHLPDLSMRKHFIRRKGTKGFSQDAIKAFAHNTFHGAYEISKLAYSHRLDKGLSIMRDHTNKQASVEDNNKARDLTSEFESRHNWIMNPTGSPLATNMTSFGFLYYLGVSPAAAMVNLSQTPLVAFPVLASRYGFKAAGKMLLQASKELIKGKGYLDKSNTLTREEQRAMKYFVSSGLVSKSMAHDLAGVAEGGQSYNPTADKWMSRASYLFHHAERLNREATAMAAFRLARSKGKKFKEAMQEAHDLTIESHFDYSSANRARYMQNDFAKVLLLFRQYSLNMTIRLWRDFKNQFSSNKEEAAQAKKQFWGMMGMTALFAGAAGLPLYSVLTGLANLFGDDEDEPWNADLALRQGLGSMLGEDMARIVMNGLMSESGANIQSRVSLNNLWLREPNRDMDGRDQVAYYAEQFLGPVYGLALSAGMASTLAKEDHTYRAVEYALPKFAKDLLKAGRYHSEGVQNLRGDEIIAADDMNLWDIVVQASGYSPTKVGDAYSKNASIKGAEQKILARRRLLLNRYALAKRLGDTERQQEVLTMIERYNQANPEYPLTRATLLKSLKRRKAYSEKAQNGIVINPNLQHVATEYALYGVQ